MSANIYVSVCIVKKRVCIITSHSIFDVSDIDLHEEEGGVG